MGGMGTSNAVRWGPAEREARRMQAASLFEQGVRQVQVARLLGVFRQAVGQWHGAWQEGGRDALVARPARHFARNFLGPFEVGRRVPDPSVRELVEAAVVSTF
ncbi:helix-turn-helix domain-containing protein [Streptomyces sp. NPDC046985]|uniref:helix-turn-helix domain-containing protein n=1 Tax=Streptomyces sp. NPDC046985 TaxID=3155377 RepID=UPI0033E5B219